MRLRTGFSFKTAYGKLEDVISRLQEIGEEVAPISDRLSTFAFTKWTKLAKQAGLRPIYGVELPVVAALGQKKPVTDHWTFFALDDLRDLHRLISICTNNPGRDPSLLYSQALSARGVIKIAGERSLLDKFPENCEQYDHLYFGLAPSVSFGQYKNAKHRGLRFLCCSDNYFPRDKDLETYRAALGRRSGTQTYPRHILSEEELRAALRANGFEEKDIEEGFENRRKCIDVSRSELSKARLIVPEKPKTLRDMCEDGAKRNGIDLTQPVYKERLERELDIIRQKQFEDYFYIVADIISYAKKHMVVGPARGSSCGSLVCYLLHITEIDPIPYGLIFERFIDINRKDLPDIDIDFPRDEKQDLIFAYAEKRFGVEHVSRLGAVGTFKGKGSLKETAKSLRVPSWKVEKVSDPIHEMPGDTGLVLSAFETTEGKELLREYPEMAIASTIEGHPRTSTQHAAGILITDAPVTEYVAVDSRSKTCWCDKYDAEELNLLKIDALAVKQLDVFERTLELIGEKPVSGFLEKLPTDDEEAFQVLNDQKYNGIFQFTGQAMRGLAKQTKLRTIDDLAALNALARPGPLNFADTWLRRKNGLEPVTTLHPLLTEITKETYGVILYQETVMQICRQMGGMSWEDTSAVRKIIGKKLGPQALELYWPKFEAGALLNGVPSPVARSLWDQIPAFGIYAFNKSHAVAYGMMGYWCCWLKAHFPVEFAAATLDAEKDPEKQIQILRELADEGVGYTPVDVEFSSDRWSRAERDGKTILVGPITGIKGIGAASLREVLDCRESGAELRASIKKKLINAKTPIDTLWPIRDRIRRLHPDLAAINILSEPTDIRDAQCGMRNDALVLAVVKRFSEIDENDAERVNKRKGRKYSGPTKAVNMWLLDDTDEVFAKIDRMDYERLAPLFLEKTKTGKSLWAVKGSVPGGFRMISIKNMRYLGEL